MFLMNGDRDLRCRRRGIGCGLLRRRWDGSGLAGTPLLQWKFHGGNPGGERRGMSGAGGGGAVEVSVRKLAASLWLLYPISDGSGGLGWQNRLFAPLRLEFPSMANPKFEMEGSTKGNSDYLKTSTDCNLVRSHVKLLENQKIANISVASAKRAELFKARDYIKELEAERGLLRTKLKCFVKKLNEENALWMRREHQKMFAILKNLKDDMKRERRKCEKMESVNSKLRSYVSDSNLSIRRFMQNYEKEKKARESLEDMCYQLGNEIEENRAEMGEIWNKCVRIKEEIEEERKMLQTAEIWRVERAKMKLVDAKLILEHKYCQMNNIAANLEALRLSDIAEDSVGMSNAKVFEQASGSINIQETKKFSHVALNSNDTSILIENSRSHEVGTNPDHCIRHNEELNLSSSCHVTLKANDPSRKIFPSNSFSGGNSGLEDTSAKDTVTQAAIGSIQNLDASKDSVNEIIRNKHDSSSQEEWDNKSHHACKKSNSSESSSVSSNQSKKKGSSPICKILRTLTSNEDHQFNTITLDRVSNGSIPSSIVSQVSPQIASDKEEILSHGCVNQGPSTEPRNPHIVRAMKGGIKWPKGIQRNGLKAKLEKQKMLLRHALKQRT